jgi:hypothetical protein
MIVDIREDPVPIRTGDFRLAEPDLREQVPIKTRAEKTAEQRRSLRAELKNRGQGEDDSQEQSEAANEELRYGQVIVHGVLRCVRRFKKPGQIGGAEIELCGVLSRQAGGDWSKLTS